MTFASFTALLGFLALAAFFASSGAVFTPGPWYRALAKPSWTPPDWAFPVVWAILFTLIAVSGWLVFEAAGFVILPFAVYLGQYVLNGLWSYLFFGIRRPDLAFFNVVALWLGIVATILVFAPISQTAALLLAPYLLWVTIAGCLNWSIWRRNPQGFALG
ncbi:MAG: tryptophan-rich sensory protein [Rhizobiaceae bacterium]|nr:tryptophan-rich sensory protein [Rhizobiaceae bacterium]